MSLAPRLSLRIDRARWADRRARAARVLRPTARILHLARPHHFDPATGDEESRVRPGEGFRSGRRLRHFRQRAGAVTRHTREEFQRLRCWVKPRRQERIGIPAPASVPEFLVKVIGEKYRLDLVSAPYRGSAPMMETCSAIRFPPASAPCRTSSRTTRLASCASSPYSAAHDKAHCPRCRRLRARPRGIRGRAVLRVLRAGWHAASAIDQFSAALSKVIAQPDVRDRLDTLGAGTVQFMPQAQVVLVSARIHEHGRRSLRRAGSSRN